VSILVVGIVFTVFRTIHRHYARVGRSLRMDPSYRSVRYDNTVVVLVGGVHKGVIDALSYAKSLSPSHLLAVTVVSDQEAQDRIVAQWSAFDIDVPLEIVYSPYREL